MKSATLSIFAGALLPCVSLFAASNFPMLDNNKIHVISDVDAVDSLQAEAQIGNAAAPAAGAQAVLPLWWYQMTAAQNGKTYAGRIVGTNPITTQTTTTVPVILVPVVFKIVEGGATYIFDPTAADPGCIGPGNTAFNLTANSPLFQNANLTFNGTGMGNTQFADAFLRAEFWLFTQNSTYHLKLNPVVGPTLTITVRAGTQGNVTAAIYAGSGTQCGNNSTGVNPPGALGVVNFNTIDAYLQYYIRAAGLTASQFPFFVTYNAVFSQGAANNQNNCCILGYHNALASGQTYGIAEFEGRNQTIFSGQLARSAAHRGLSRA